MNFQLTAAGRAAGVAAAHGGYDLVFANFTVGSAFGYTPLPSDVALHGTTLYTGLISGFANDNGTLQFMANMDGTVGDFMYGEMGLWLDDGTLFALGALPSLQEKYAKPSGNANQILETIRVVWADAVPNITWVINPAASTNLLEYAQFELVPPSSVAPVNAAIVHVPDDFGNESIIYTQGAVTDLWSISTHDYQAIADTVDAATIGSNTFLSSADHGSNLTPAGRYLIQFTSGDSKGMIRPVTAIAGKSITMSTAMGIAPGDSFVIMQSTMSYMTIAAQQAAQQGRLKEIRMWDGTPANIPAVWGPGWYLCDGTNGTPDLRDKFIVGAGGAYVNGAVGGASTVTLGTANMPQHTHTITDPGHVHGYTDPGHAHAIYDPGHSHPVYDPGHSHTMTNRGSSQAGADNGGTATTVDTGYGTGRVMNPTDPAGTGIAISGAVTGIATYGAGVGISIRSNTTGITITASGSATPTPVNILPPYYALCYVCYTGV